MGLDSAGDYAALARNEQNLADWANLRREEDGLARLQKEEDAQRKIEERGALIEGLIEGLSALEMSLRVLPLPEERDLSAIYVGDMKWAMVVLDTTIGHITQGGVKTEAIAKFYRYKPEEEADKQKFEKEGVVLIAAKEGGRLNVQMKEGAKPWAKVPGRMQENGIGDPKFTPVDLASNPEAEKALPYSLTELKEVISAANKKVDGLKRTHGIR